MPAREVSHTATGTHLPIRLPRPREVMVVVAAWLVVGWAAFVVVDVFNVAGSRDALFELVDLWPYTFTTLFGEGGPTEWLQWSALGLTVAFSAVASTQRMRAGQRDSASFWLLLSAAAILMFMEDAGGVRHTVSQWAARLGGGTAGYAAEFAVYGMIVAVPLYAVVRYRRYFLAARKPRNFLIGTAAAYALAGTSSALRDFWYDTAGRWLIDVALGGRLPPFPPEAGPITVEFLLLDHLLEESVELIGAALFLCVALAAIASFDQRDDVES